MIRWPMATPSVRDQPEANPHHFPLLRVHVIPTGLCSNVEWARIDVVERLLESISELCTFIVCHSIHMTEIEYLPSLGQTLFENVLNKYEKNKRAA